MALDVALPSLLDVMDMLWFHQIVLLSSPSLPTKTLHEQTRPLFSKSLPNDQALPLHEQEQEQGEEILVRPSRAILNRGRSHSSSPLTKKRHRRRRVVNSNRATTREQELRAVHSCLGMSMMSSVGEEAMMVFQRSSSSCCKRLRDLELEEVKGFMDLGFRFKQESLSPKMMSIVPGLQRLAAAAAAAANDADEDGYGEMGVIRPYLSKAWVISKRRPDSALLNMMRLPRVSAGDDMKRHLKFWARTVASVIHQES